MEHLLSHLRLESLRRGAMLLFDYDGTLTPIVERPELAVLNPDMKRLFKSLDKRFKVAIISGRSLADIKKLVGLKGIYYAGNHGFEISGPRVYLVNPEAERVAPVMAEICNKLRAKAASIKGIIVENKGLTASVHYRLVRPGRFGALRKAFNKIVKPSIDAGIVKVTRGKKVLEIRPNVEWDKGKAVLWLVDVINPPGGTSIFYVGDDRTDEDAFLALKDKAITILVSKKPKKSHAKFFLKNVREVGIFLKKLVEKRTSQISRPS